ncbi:ubiquinol-cytochrome C chaperone family protein [Kiloniella sp. EL199]|uniref:ubiquinol-cytochrome C chaperone family protein n=1 Tax=Kiloniella sp. EL199 TaxID=2107581 RepID=UPI000EA3DD10|nr:ubiquinol-cytochrome C chaperone family protein [Kiloniella sp. EL199]
MFRKLFRRDSESDAVHDLYACLIEQARHKDFYENHSVPDSLDGRFDMITLHMFLVLHRLKTEKETTESFSQKLFDLMFYDMDLSLREMGVGDVGVGKRVKAMLQGFYGRLAAYEDALQQGEKSLEDALVRNLYGTIEADQTSVQYMREYLIGQIECLKEQDIAQIMSGRITFCT